MIDWRRQCHRYSTRFYGPSPQNAALSWIGDQRIAVGSLPTAATLPALTENGITHIVNCRSIAQTWISQDLAVERALLGPSRVVHAPMLDFGHPQPPQLWSAAALFAAGALADDPAARVLIHCHPGAQPVCHGDLRRATPRRTQPRSGDRPHPPVPRPSANRRRVHHQRRTVARRRRQVGRTAPDAVAAGAPRAGRHVPGPIRSGRTAESRPWCCRRAPVRPPRTA